MGIRSYPPLTVAEIKAVLKNLGFEWDRTEGSHSQWKRLARDGRPAAVITVDEHYKEIGDKLLKNIIQQSTFTREQFYGASKWTAKKIGIKFARCVEGPEAK